MSKNTHAFPHPWQNDNRACSGLTKREWFAGMALHGLLSTPMMGTREEYAVQAALFADALLKELSDE